MTLHSFNVIKNVSIINCVESVNDLYAVDLKNMGYQVRRAYCYKKLV